jgi:hypothetical protein
MPKKKLLGLKDLRSLLLRAMAALENPKDLSRKDVEYLIEDLFIAAKELER